jgi:hypothetical protein
MRSSSTLLRFAAECMVGQDAAVGVVRLDDPIPFSSRRERPPALRPPAGASNRECESGDCLALVHPHVTDCIARPPSGHQHPKGDARANREGVPAPDELPIDDIGPDSGVVHR